MRFATLVLSLLLFIGCASKTPPTTASESQVRQATVDVPVTPSGLTVEQENIRNRLLADNKPGSLKHLYVISAYSGQVLIYSTVKSKVTSSGKRLTPTTVAAGDGTDVYSKHHGFAVDFKGSLKNTGEVLQDDGTYGTSVDYLYWWDAQGRYHQHYVSGGQIVHISDQPLNVRGVIINMEVSSAGKPTTEEPSATGKD